MARDDKLADAITNLRRHLRSCKECMAAKKALTPHRMCSLGLMQTLLTVIQFDDCIRLRIAAHNHPGHTVFACPDLSKHGKAYALTAEPMMVTGIQGGLF